MCVSYNLFIPDSFPTGFLQVLQQLTDVGEVSEEKFRSKF